MENSFERSRIKTKIAIWWYSKIKVNIWILVRNNMLTIKTLLSLEKQKRQRLFQRTRNNNYAEIFKNLEFLYQHQKQIQQLFDFHQHKIKQLTVLIHLNNDLQQKAQTVFYRKINQYLRQFLNFLTLKSNYFQSQLPNIPHQSVPVGDEKNNQIIEQSLDYEKQKFAELKTKLFLRHDQILQQFDLLETVNTTKMTTSRTVTYQGLASRLLRALQNFLLDYHVQNNYLEITPPYFVKRKAMINTGQFPKAENDSYQLGNLDLYLIPTAEVSLVNLYYKKLFKKTDLPHKVCAYSPCFRKEAGAAGQKTAGIIRLHQFHKVEVVQFVEASKSYQALIKMTKELGNILKLLKIPFRIVNLASEDLAFQAAKTLDLEVWWPSQQQFLEISSISNTEAFQASSLQIKYLNDVNKEHVHILNGSGLAIDRLLAVLIEYYFDQKKQTFLWPPILAKYLNQVG